MKYLSGFLLSSLLLFAACQKKNNNSPVPSISSVILYPESVKGGFYKDTAYLTFHIIDGDADLGNDAGSGNYDIFLRDSRDTAIQRLYFPYIREEYKDADRGMEGDCTIILLASTLIPRQDTVHKINGDTLHYELYIHDRAQHESNHVTTPDIILRP